MWVIQLYCTVEPLWPVASFGTVAVLKLLVSSQVQQALVTAIGAVSMWEYWDWRRSTVGVRNHSSAHYIM